MESDDGAGACRLIGLNATLRAECERVAPVLREAKRAATEAELMEILIRNAPAYKVTPPAGGNWAFLFGPYVDALEGFPAYAIEDAFLRWNRGEGHANLQMASFYPTPGQLAILANKGKADLWMAAYRAEKALAQAERTAGRRISDEERKANGEKLKELLSEMAAGRKAPESRPAHGLTPQQLAEQLRAKAAEPDDVGDVI